MEELFLVTKRGLVKIDPAMVEKYHLVSGTMSPFTRCRITNEEGATQEEKEYNEDAFGSEETKGELVNDGIAQLDNGMTLSHSEMLDFAQGTDSSNR
jgi:hypothetical protein